MGPDPVVGEPSRRGHPVGLGGLGTLGEHAGEGGVQPGPLPGQQLGVQRLLGQRVPERVGLGGRIGNQHLVGDGRPQRGQQVRLGQLADRGQQPVPDPAAGRGHQPQRRLRVLGQDLDAAQQDLLETRGQAAPVVGSRLGGGEQLLGEERVALRAAVDLADELVVRSRPDDAGQQVGDLGTVEAAHLEPLPPGRCGPARPGTGAGDGGGAARRCGRSAPRAARPGGCGRGRRAGPGSSGRPSAGPPPPARSGTGRPGAPAGRAAPRTAAPAPTSRRPGRSSPPPARARAAAGPAAAGPARPARPGPPARARGPGRGAPGPGARTAAPSRPVDAAAEQHLPAALADPTGEPGDQPGLADAGLAADAQGQRIAAAGVGERRLQTAQLCCAIDEPRARDGPGHGEEYALDLLGREPVPGTLRPKAGPGIGRCP